MDSRKYSYRVIPQEIDFTGKARFSSIVNNLLNTAGEDARLNGFGIDVLSERNLGWILLRLGVELDSRPHEGDEYVVETWVTDYSSLTTTRCFKIFNAGGECIGRAVSIWCLLDFAQRRPAPMAGVADLAEGTTTDLPMPCAAPMKLRPFEGEPCSSHSVKYMDIDFNRHMNTLRYIDLLVDELPIEVVAADRKIRVDVHFVKESVFGEKLFVYRQEEKLPEEEGEGSEGEGTPYAYRMEIKKEDGTLSILARIQGK